MSLPDYAVKYRPYKENSEAGVVEQVTSTTKQWYDGCEYKCALGCPHITKSRNGMAHHLKSVHKTTFQEGVNFHVIKESYMPCQICSLDMLHCEGGIRVHMTKFHSLTLEDYGDQYVKDGIVRTSAPDPIDNIKGMEVPRNIPWHDRCAYRCQSCMSIFWRVKDINGHIKKCNDGHAEKETVRSVIHVCQICGYKVLHETSALASHMANRHMSNLSDYGVKYKPYKENYQLEFEQDTSTTKQWFDGCEYKCALGCPHIAKSRNGMSHHLKSAHKTTFQEGVNFHVIQESFMPCQICSLDMLQSEGIIRRHMTICHSVTLEDYGEKYVKDGIVKTSAPDPLDQIKGMIAPKNIPWYDRCAYRCKSCLSIYWAAKDILDHIRKCNGGHAEKETVRNAIHKCKICGFKVLHEKSTLTSHIAKRHGTSLSDYGMKYQMFKEKQESVDDQVTSTKQWFDGCEFRCALNCPHTSKSRNAMGQHLKSIHKRKPKEGISYHVIKDAVIPCQICSIDMSHTAGEIRRHLSQFHSMTLEDYADRYVTDGIVKMSAPDPIDKIAGIAAPKNIPWYDKCAYRCMSCTNIFWTVANANGHIKKCNGGHAKKETVRNIIHICHICGRRLLQERSSLESHLSSKHSTTLSEYGMKYKPYKEKQIRLVKQEVTTTKQWFDGCEYTCALNCPHTAKSRNAMGQHLKSVHKKKASEGINYHVIQESLIPCQICSLDMFHNEGEIRKHLTRFHSITMEDYADRYVTDGIVKTSIPDPVDLIKGVNAPKNIPWYDRCAYRCKSCTEIFWTVGHVKGHLQKCNGGHADKDTVRNTIHICKICQRRLLQERSCLESHMSSRHSMTLSEYAVKFTPYADENPAMAVEEATEENLHWFDGCEYECLTCKQSLKTRNAVAHHLKGVHKILNAKEGEHFRTVLETSLDCKLCSVSIFRNEGQIRAHLTKNHNTTMEEYAAKYVHGGVADEITHFLDAAPTQVGEQGNVVNEDIEVPRNVMWYNRSVIRTWDNFKIC